MVEFCELLSRLHWAFLFDKIHWGSVDIVECNGIYLLDNPNVQMKLKCNEVWGLNGWGWKILSWLLTKFQAAQEGNEMILRVHVTTPPCCACWNVLCALPLLVSWHYVWNGLSGHKRLLKKCKSSDVQHNNRWGTFSKFFRDIPLSWRDSKKSNVKGMETGWLMKKDFHHQTSHYWMYGYTVHDEADRHFLMGLIMTHTDSSTVWITSPFITWTLVPLHSCHSSASLCDLQIHSWLRCVTEMGKNELFLPHLPGWQLTDMLLSLPLLNCCHNRLSHLPDGPKKAW